MGDVVGGRATGGWHGVVLLIACAVALPSVLAQDVPVARAAPWLAWRSEVIDFGISDGNPSVVVDSLGRPHIIYDDGQTTSIKYAFFDGIAWTMTPLANSDRAVDPSIALDAMDRPHISFYAGATGSLKYASFDGSQWSFEVVEPGGNVGGSSQIRLDANGRPHIGYMDIATNAMKYAFKDEGGWHVETVDTGVFLSWAGMDIDANNRPHLAYSVPGGFWGKGKYATRSANGSWSIEVFESQGGTDVGIAVDALGRPHISYMGAGETLKYAVRNGGSWSIEVADSADAPTGWYTSIDTDSQNRPHISYWQVFNRGNVNDPTRGHLKYATRLANGQWSREYVDLASVSIEPSIAVDEQDRPRIAYLLWYRPLLVSSRTELDLAYAEPLSASFGRLGQ